MVLNLIFVLENVSKFLDCCFHRGKHRLNLYGTDIYEMSTNKYLSIICEGLVPQQRLVVLHKLCILVRFSTFFCILKSFFLLSHMRCGIKVINLIFYLPKFLFLTNINAIHVKIVPFGSYTPMETLFPLLVAALEIFNRYSLQHVPI